MTLLHCFVHLVSHEFVLGIIFVCFVWVVAMTEKGTTNSLGVDEVGWYGTLFYAEVPASDPHMQH